MARFRQTISWRFSAAPDGEYIQTWPWLEARIVELRLRQELRHSCHRPHQLLLEQEGVGVIYDSRWPV